MTITIFNEFVDKILVHEHDTKDNHDTTKDVEIYFNFVNWYVSITLWKTQSDTERIGGSVKERGTQGQGNTIIWGTQKRYEDKTKQEEEALSALRI